MFCSLQSAPRSKKSTVYCCIDLNWTKGCFASDLLNKTKKTVDSGSLCFFALPCSHILLDKIKQRASILIHSLYVGEYCNPVGCSLILFYTHITERYFFSMAHLLTASVKPVPRLETRCAAEQDPSITQRLLIPHAERSSLPRWRL